MVLQKQNVTCQAALGPALSNVIQQAVLQQQILRSSTRAETRSAQLVAG
jgi:hypothetical protein